MTLPQMATAFLVGLLFPSLIAALPQQPDAAPNDIWHYSNDPACIHSACVADCRNAAIAVCDQVGQPSSAPTINVTVNHCQAFYKWNLGNTVATKDSCYAAFTRINDAGAKGAGPNECGGTVGGALGFDEKGDRTNDPLYILNPTDGNGNCFKAPGDNTQPLPVDELENGEKLPMPDTCPSNTARRRRDALQPLERRGSAGTIDCAVADGMLLIGCTARCMSWTVATIWWLPEIEIPVFAGCFGTCLIPYEIIAFKDCSKKGNKPRAIERGQSQSNPCNNIMDNPIQVCPAIRNKLLGVYSCPGADSAGEGEVVAAGSGGTINT